MIPLVSVRISTVFSALILGVLSFLGACTQQHPAALPTPPSFKFELEKVTELLLSKSDPSTGDHWAARFEKSAPGTWTIASGPAGMPLGDRIANSAFIEHVLDTTRTAKSQQATLSGPLESFGLTEPRFRLQWKAPEIQDEYDFRLGSPALTSDPTNGDPIAGSYSSADGKTVWITTGAVLEMLSRVSTFDTLRQNQLLVLPPTETTDDVDLIVIETLGQNPKPIYYAERAGNGWVDSKKHPIEAEDFLVKLAHLRVLRFVDDATESTKILKAPTFLKITLQDLSGKKVEIELRTNSAKNKVYATVSTREADSGPAVFEIYPDLLAWVKQL
jgi:hypothetical protein